MKKKVNAKEKAANRRKRIRMIAERITKTIFEDLKDSTFFDIHTNAYYNLNEYKADIRLTVMRVLKAQKKVAY